MSALTTPPVVTGRDPGWGPAIGAGRSRTRPHWPESRVFTNGAKGRDPLHQFHSEFTDDLHAGGVVVGPKVGADEQFSWRSAHPADAPHGFFQMVTGANSRSNRQWVSLHSDDEGVTRKLSLRDFTEDILPWFNLQLEMMHACGEVVHKDFNRLIPLTPQHGLVIGRNSANERMRSETSLACEGEAGLGVLEKDLLDFGLQGFPDRCRSRHRSGKGSKNVGVNSGGDATDSECLEPTLDGAGLPVFCPEINRLTRPRVGLTDLAQGRTLFHR
jgi:hypothetical protein